MRDKESGVSLPSAELLDDTRTMLGRVIDRHGLNNPEFNERHLSVEITDADVTIECREDLFNKMSAIKIGYTNTDGYSATEELKFFGHNPQKVEHRSILFLREDRSALYFESSVPSAQELRQFHSFLGYVGLVCSSNGLVD